jgi:tetratricopeptide (TPR) repeat protein
VVFNNELNFLQALKLFREMNHLTNTGMTLYWLGRLAAFRNDRTADARFDEAAEVLKQAGAYHQVGRILVGKGDSAFARCDFYAAREEYIKAISLYQETGFLQAGDLELYEDRFDEASTFYRRALLAAESLGLAEEEAQCRVKLGTLELFKGQPRVGTRHLVVAAAAQRRISDVKGLGQTLVRLGQCFVADGDGQRALLLFRAAYPVCRHMESLRDLADCLVGIGTVCLDREPLVEGAALYERTGDTKGRERCMVVLGGL